MRNKFINSTNLLVPYFLFLIFANFLKFFQSLSKYKLTMFSFSSFKYIIDRLFLVFNNKKFAIHYIFKFSKFFTLYEVYVISKFRPIYQLYKRLDYSNYFYGNW